MVRIWSGPPELPLPPGASVQQRMEPLVNGERTLVTLAQTLWRPEKVEAFYRSPTLRGWRLEVPSQGEPSGRLPLTLRREGWQGTVFSCHDAQRKATTLLTRVRPAQPEADRRKAGLAGWARRWNGFPLFPGVTDALVVESGAPPRRTTLLFETAATLEQVAQFYRHRLGAGAHPFLANTAGHRCVSGLVRIRQGTILLSLCRRRGGGTSALAALERRPLAGVGWEKEVGACFGGGI